MRLGRNRALTVWILVWAAVGAVGVLMYLIGRLPVMNPPQCPGDELRLPDGTRCIIGADIGAGLLLLFSIGLTAVGGLGVLVTPLAALLIRTVRARPPGILPSLPSGSSAVPPWTPATPDWAGRRPGPPPAAPASAPGTNPLCLTSMVTGILAVGFLVACALLSVPLGVVAVMTGALGLGELKDHPSGGRRQALAGISCGAGSLLLLTVIFVVFILTG